MGCFPEKTLDKDHSPEKRRLIDQFREQNPANHSLYIPASVRHPNESKTFHSRRPPKYPFRKARSPPSSEKRSPEPMKTIASEPNPKQFDKEPKYSRKNPGSSSNFDLRKRGTVIELPFRPHIITKIETPSESAKTSLISNVQHHPSLFFMRIRPETSSQPEVYNNTSSVQSKKLFSQQDGSGKTTEKRVL